MAFALSQVYLDLGQRRTYMREARQQLNLARQNMQVEQGLAPTGVDRYAAGLLQLAQLEDKLKATR